MAWSGLSASSAGSHLIAQSLLDILAFNHTTASGPMDFNQTTTNLCARMALYDLSLTPSASATGALLGYGGAGSPWSSLGSTSGSVGNGTAANTQVFGAVGTNATDWVVGGRDVNTPSLARTDFLTGCSVGFQCLATSNTNAVTLSNIGGMFIYFPNTTTAGGGSAASAGVGFWYFGGSNYGVTSGTLTITATNNTLFTITV